MWFLVHSYEDQGRIKDAMKLCEETTELVEKFGGQGLGPRHKIWEQLRAKREELAREQDMERSLANGDGNINLSNGSFPPKKAIKFFTF